MSLSNRITLMLILSATAGVLSSIFALQLIPRGMFLGIFLTAGLFYFNRRNATQLAKGEPPRFKDVMLCGTGAGAAAGLIIMVYGTGGADLDRLSYDSNWYSPGVTMVSTIAAGILLLTAYAYRLGWQSRKIRFIFTLLSVAVAGYLQGVIRGIAANIGYYLFASYLISPGFDFIFTPLNSVFFAILWYLAVVFLDPANDIRQPGQASRESPAVNPEP